MKNIVLTFTTVSWQKGAAAQVISFVSELRKITNDVNIILISNYLDLDREPADKLHLEIYGYPLNKNTKRDLRSIHLLLIRVLLINRGIIIKFGVGCKFLINEPVAKAYLKADLIVDLSGDSYRDRPGGVSIAHNINFLAAISNGIPYILISQSIGPFKKYNRMLTRYCLKKAKMIYIREKYSEKILYELGINKELIHLAPDLAFVLPRDNQRSINDIFKKDKIFQDTISRPWIGISISALIMLMSEKNGINKYIDDMIEIAMYVHNKIEASILLIPHQTHPIQLGIDDAYAISIVYEKCNKPNWLYPIISNYDPCELKQLIACCDSFIGARMHAAIAAISSGVPTITVSWTHKYKGLMEQIGADEFVWEIDNTGNTKLCDIFDKLWMQRNEIRVKLNQFTSNAQPIISNTVKSVVDILNE